MALKYAFFFFTHTQNIILSLRQKHAFSILKHEYNSSPSGGKKNKKQNNDHFCLLLPRGTVGGAMLVNNITAPGNDKCIS